ncbi:alpha/beta hydrolase [Nonomuraea sp. NPDC059194]|uniref:alpha/beta hydrolase n=1 Tax=Nonomuraea sp. NPDC059194 TaxID=3346764 RepID=UPI00368B81A2
MRKRAFLLVLALLAIPAPVRADACDVGAAPRMDVYPGRAPGRPGVFVVHGGWWSQGDKSDLSSVARRFASLGYAVFNLNYRLSGTATWPAPRDDVLAAIAHARDHAARYGFDPDRYVIVGFSAGGHLALEAGEYEGGPEGLRGVVGFSPVVSPTSAYWAGGAANASALARRLRESAVALAGCPPYRCPGTWSSMEVEGVGVPALIVHSAGEFVPARPSLALHARSPLVSVLVLPGSGHSTALYGQATVAAAAERWIAAVLTA